jgi:hypothetical protein
MTSSVRYTYVTFNYLSSLCSNKLFFSKTLALRPAEAITISVLFVPMRMFFLGTRSMYVLILCGIYGFLN